MQGSGGSWRRVFLLSGLLWALAGCQPRNIIPTPRGAASTTVSDCDKLPNCGQCVSDARCGFCAKSNRCMATERAQACESGWIPKDPEQTLCQADAPARPATK